MLGRGLESLISSSKPEKKGRQKEEKIIYRVEIEKIEVNPYQPRKRFEPESIQQLSDSIKQYGLLQPLIVSKVKRKNKIIYQLIAGHRRLLAAKKLGLKYVPVVIKNVSHDGQKLEMALVENVVRSNLNPIEEALAYSVLMNQFNLTQKQIAQKVGRSREAISNSLRLLTLPQNIKQALIDKRINESQARLLLSLSPEKQQSLFQKLINHRLTVRELRAEIKTPVASKDPEILELERQLEESLQAKVSIVKNKKGQGRITIKFFSYPELNSLVEKLTH